MKGQIHLINKDLNKKCVILCYTKLQRGLVVLFSKSFGRLLGLLFFVNADIKFRFMGYNFRCLRYMYLCLLFNFAELLGHAWIYMSRMHARLCGWVILCTQTFPVKVLDSKDTLISSILYWLISGPCTLKRAMWYVSMCATV